MTEQLLDTSIHQLVVDSVKGEHSSGCGIEWRDMPFVGQQRSPAVDSSPEPLDHFCDDFVDVRIGRKGLQCDQSGYVYTNRRISFTFEANEVIFVKEFHHFRQRIQFMAYSACIQHIDERRDGIDVWRQTRTASDVTHELVPKG